MRTAHWQASRVARNRVQRWVTPWLLYHWHTRSNPPTLSQHLAGLRFDHDGCVTRGRCPNSTPGKEHLQLLRRRQARYPMHRCPEMGRRQFIPPSSYRLITWHHQMQAPDNLICARAFCWLIYPAVFQQSPHIIGQAACQEHGVLGTRRPLMVHDLYHHSKIWHFEEGALARQYLFRTQVSQSPSPMRIRGWMHILRSTHQQMRRYRSP